MTELQQANQYRTKSQIVLDAIRRRIISGALEPGARLTLRPIAEEFACSEIPVREAMRALASAGYVELVPHGGARVTELDGAQLVELTEVRSLLEPRATRLAAEAMPKEVVKELRDLLEAMRLVVEGRSDRDYGRLNREFHRRILECCPNAKLAETINELWDQADRGRMVHRFFAGHMRISLDQHERMFDAIVERDLDAVERFATVHSEHGLAAVRRLVGADAAEAEGVPA